jgi:hypothetical protein
MWIAIVLGLVAVAAVGTWWAQRRATIAAAELLTRAVRADADAPDVPAWPLEAPFAARPDADAFPFDPERPTLVVLLHGMTPNRELDPDVGTHAYARRYWGFAFVRALLDGHAPRLVDGEPLAADTWTADVPGADAPDGDAVAYGLFLPSTDADDAAAPRDAAAPSSAAEERPLRAVFVPVRDGSRGLGEQVVAAAAQIDAGLERYRAWLASATDAAVAGDDAADDLGDREPQVVLIGHSFGGLIARYLLTNPPVDGGPFGTDAATQARADRLRDRTLYLITLGTPHEGSAAADRAELMAATQELFRAEMVRPNAFARRWLTPLLDEGASFLRLEDPVTEHLRTDVWATLNDPQDGLLAAHRARRGDGSAVPVLALAARSPGGRFFVDPLVSDRIEWELAAWYAERIGLEPTLYRDFLVQMLLADPTMHVLGVPTRGWGAAEDHPAPTEVLDRVTRAITAPERVTIGRGDARLTLELAARVDFVRGPYTGEIPTRGLLGRLWCAVVRCGEAPGVLDVGSVADVDLSGVDAPTVAIVRDLLLGREPPGATPPVAQPEGRVGDGEIDADGVVPVDSALGWRLGSDGDGPYFAIGQTWPVGAEQVPGAWYRPDAAAPGGEQPWTFLHHIDLQWDPTVAEWIATTWLGAAGPDPVGDADPAPDAVSAWR